MNEAVIKELDSIDAVRQKYTMFISNRNRAQLVNEGVANACDEALAGYCDKIDVFCKINEDNERVWYIRDNGRGIPLKTNNDTDGVISIATKLYSGGKYDNEIYKTSSGTHGLGVILLNGLSKWLKITTLARNKDSDHVRYSFKDGKFELQKLIHLRTKDGSIPFSTELQFVIDDEFFDSKDLPPIDESFIERELMLAKHVLQDRCTIFFNGEEIQDTYFQEFLGDNYVEVISGDTRNKKTEECCHIDISLYDDFDSGKCFKGIVNMLECNEGTHKNVVQTLLKNKLTELSEKNKKYIQSNDFFIPIRINCELQLSYTAFEEQVKNTLAVSRQDIINLIEPVIDNLLKNNKEFFNNLLDRAEEYRVNLESNKKSKQGKRGKTVQVKGLFECSSRNPKERNLYLVEGQSAGGSLLSARNPKTDSVLALQGKVLNVVGTDKKKVSQKERLSDMVIQAISTTLGYKIFGEIDISKCRYKNIFIVVDADVDGKHICCLLITMFYTLFPELIKAGMLYLVQCPLFGTKYNKTFIPIFDKKEYDEYSKKGCSITRYKGLGEMNSNELYQSAINPQFRRCLQLKYEDLDMKDIWCNKLGIMREETYNVDSTAF